MKNQSTLFVFLLILFSCFSIKTYAQQKGFTIKGKIIGAKDGEKVYLKELRKMTYVDSCSIVGERFLLKGEVNEPLVGRIRYNDEYASLMLENVPIQFTASNSNWLPSVKIVGGKEQVLKNRCDEIELPFNIAFQEGIDSLNNKLYANKEQKLEIVNRLNRMSDENLQKYIAFGKANPNSFLGLDILYRNRQSIGKKEIAELFAKMNPKIRNSSVGKTLALFVKTPLIQEGQDFSDFTVKTINNEEFTLSSLKGQYIYLTFWEKSCGPCRLENRLFAKEIDRLSSKIKVVSFSLDEDRQNWKVATKEDGIRWYNVSDSKGNESPIKIRYDVQSIPHSFLIDKAGKIIKIFSGYSENMVNELLSLAK